MASLEKLLGMGFDTYFPAHGDPVTNPARLVRGMIGHRRQRESQILRVLGQSAATVPEMVATMYVGLDPALVRGAGASVLAHLYDLRGRGAVIEEGEVWRLAA
jgi:glyoxylase-like metal-dependent hydrolase (beta-lactamase superfamily II)